MTIRNPDFRSEFDNYLTQTKQYFGTDTELAYIYQSCCFVLEVEQLLIELGSALAQLAVDVSKYPSSQYSFLAKSWRSKCFPSFGGGLRGNMSEV